MKFAKRGENPFLMFIKEIHESGKTPYVVIMNGTDTKNGKIRFFNGYQYFSDASLKEFYKSLEDMLIESKVTFKKRKFPEIGMTFNFANINDKAAERINDFATKILINKSEYELELVNFITAATFGNADAIMFSTDL